MSWQRQVIVQSPSNSPGFDPFNSNSWSRWLRPLWLINCLDLSQAAVDPTCRIPSSYWFILVKHFLRFHDREETAYQILSVLNCEDVLWRVTLFVTFVTIFHTVILTLARRHFRRVKVSALSTDTHTPTENSHFSCGSSEELFKIYLRHGLKAFTQSGQVNSKHVTHTHCPRSDSQSFNLHYQRRNHVLSFIGYWVAILPFTTCHCLCCFAETGSKWKLAEFAARLQCYKSGGRPGRGQTSP